MKKGLAPHEKRPLAKKRPDGACRPGPVPSVICRHALPDRPGYFLWILSGFICMIRMAAIRHAPPATQNAML